MSIITPVAFAAAAAAAVVVDSVLCSSCQPPSANCKLSRLHAYIHMAGCVQCSEIVFYCFASAGDGGQSINLNSVITTLLIERISIEIESFILPSAMSL